MPADQPKGQHFVHRAYLEGFQDPALLETGKRALWVYLPGKDPFPQAPERVAKRNYYYCHRRENEREFHVEHGLQKLEDAALPILLRFRSGDFSMSDEDRLTFAGYVALSHTRVPTFERTTNKISELVEGKMMELYLNNPSAMKSVLAKHEAETGEKLNADEIHQAITGGNVVLRQSDRGWSLRQMLTSMIDIQRLIVGMHWCFLRAPTDTDGFLTSDNPVSLFDPLAAPGMGIGFASSPAAHFVFPISKDFCLLAEHHPNPTSTNLNASGVREVNRGTITRADGQLYAPFNRRAVRELFDSVHLRKEKPRRVLLKRGRLVEE